MFVRDLCAIVLVVVYGLFVQIMTAQSSVPQSYTLVMSSNMALEAIFANSAAEIKVSRFGPREFADVTVAPRAGQPKAVHVRHWFDLVAHKVYSLDVVLNTCSWMSYTAADMPAMYDPLATPALSVADLAKLNQNTVRKGNINGIAARLVESFSEQGKSNIWLAENGNYPLKAEIVIPGSSEPILIQEVKELHFEKPPAALLAPPANCPTQAQGEWTADGISAHGESSIAVQGSGEKDLKTGKTTGKATVNSGSKPHCAFAQSSTTAEFTTFPPCPIK
jgi:hypothetical protein